MIPNEQSGNAGCERTRVFVISLESAKTRRARFIRHAADCEEAKVDWSFFDAHEGLTPTMKYDEQDQLICLGRRLHPRELGCYASHYSLWERIAGMEVPHVLVLEDDVVIDWHFVRLLLDADLAGRNIHYLKLYNMRPVRFRILQENFLSRRSLIRFSGFAYGAQAYVLTPEGARRFVEAFRNVRSPIDDEMDRDWQHGMPNLALFPAPVFEVVGSSTIGDQRYDEKVSLPGEIVLKRFLFRVREKLMRGVSTFRL